MVMGGKLAKTLKYIIIGIILVSMIMFIFSTDFRAVGEELSTIGYRFFYLIAVSACAYLLATWSWQMCLGPDKGKISIFQLFAVRQVCETVGLYNPTSIVGGDILKVHFLKNYDIDTKNSLSSVAISRITAILSQLFLFLIAGCWFLMVNNSSLLTNTIQTGIYIVLFILVLLQLILFWWLSTGEPKVSSMNKGVLGIRLRFTAMLNDIKYFFQQHKKAFWYSYFLSLLHWIIGSLEFYLILLFLGLNFNIMHGILLDMSVIIIKSFGAFVPGQLGIEEMGNKMMLSLIGVSSVTIWITVSLIRRARQLIWVAFGLVLYLGIKKSLHYAETQ